MKAALINTYDILGGAARAAYRLHKGLQREIGSQLIVLHKYSEDSSVLRCCGALGTDELDRVNFTAIQDQYINNNRTAISNSWFSLPYPGYDLSLMPEVQNADIINLHWVALYQSPITLQKLFGLGKPVVWTLHDLSAFTGGCHYSAGCHKYRKDCSPCPQLAEDPFGLPGRVLKDKLELFKGANLTLVTPSQWLSECAKESNIFNKLRIATIPNSLDTDLFIPLSKETARNNLGLPREGLILLFGSENGNERRKGFKELSFALRTCIESVEFTNLINSNKITFTCFGQPSRELEYLGIKVIQLGYLDTDEQVRDAYCAADIFVLPSLEDNLPNTLLESMSCGTPVIAFNVGGMPDVIVDDQTGRLVTCGDTGALAGAILSLVFDQEKRDRIGRNCRVLMKDKYSLQVQARSYIQLYADLLKGSAAEDSSRFKKYQGSGYSTSHIETQVGPNINEIFDQMLFRSLEGFVRKLNVQLQESHEWETTLKEQLAQEQENTRQMRQWAERTEALLTQERQTGALLREWAERNEKILAEERKRITLFENELSPLKAFAQRVNWLYRIYLRLRQLRRRVEYNER